jgi:sortase A
VERSFLVAGVGLLAYVASVRVEAAMVKWAFEDVLERCAAGSADAMGVDGIGDEVEARTARDRLVESELTPLEGDAGVLVGQLSIPRIGLSEIILEGTDHRTLRRAIGHIPGTALPGQAGNVGLAGHRDGSFRRLKELGTGDILLVKTRTGSLTYRVDSLFVVEPVETDVLSSSREPRLTLVTCYPFYYVGPAPQRFIVQAREVALGVVTPPRKRPPRERQYFASTIGHGEAVATGWPLARDRK